MVKGLYLAAWMFLLRGFQSFQTGLSYLPRRARVGRLQ
jgi:hypothetical protein